MPISAFHEDVSRDPSVQLMLSCRTLREETRRNYVKAIRFFCEFFGKKPFEVEEFKDLSED